VAVRPAVTAATGGAGNVPVSITEDLISTVLSVLSIILPALVGVFLILLIALVGWWIWRRINGGKSSEN
jgi:predicted Na+-dependent transporter